MNRFSNFLHQVGLHPCIIGEFYCDGLSAIKSRDGEAFKLAFWRFMDGKFDETLVLIIRLRLSGGWFMPDVMGICYAAFFWGAFQEARKRVGIGK